MDPPRFNETAVYVPRLNEDVSQQSGQENQITLEAAYEQIESSGRDYALDASLHNLAPFLETDNLSI